MKKIFILLSLLALVSCGTQKYEKLPYEKQEEISNKINERIEERLEQIDMSSYTHEKDMTEENLKPLNDEILRIKKEVVEEIKAEYEWVDFSIVEERIY